MQEEQTTIDLLTQAAKPDKEHADNASANTTESSSVPVGGGLVLPPIEPARQSVEEEEQKKEEREEELAMATGIEQKALPVEQRQSFLFFGDTNQNAEHYGACAHYGVAFGELSFHGFGHLTQIIFGGDGSDAMTDRYRPAPGARWMRWMSQKKSVDGLTTPDSTTASLRADSGVHRVLIGRRDMEKLRFLPFGELPPPRPKPAEADDALRALQAGTPVLRAEWSLYNTTVAELFADLRIDVASDAFAVWTFCKLVLMCVHTIAGGDDHHGWLHKQSASRGCSETHTALLSMMLLTQGSQGSQEGGLKATLWHVLDELLALRGVSTVAETKRTMRHVATRKHSPAVVAAMIRVVAGLQAWALPGGSLHALLCEQGWYAYATWGGSATGVGWQLISMHGGGFATLDGLGCVHRFPTGFDEASGRVVWRNASEVVGAYDWSTAVEWASRLTTLLRAMAFALCEAAVAPNAVRGLQFEPRTQTPTIVASDAEFATGRHLNFTVREIRQIFCGLIDTQGAMVAPGAGAPSPHWAGDHVDTTWVANVSPSPVADCSYALRSMPGSAVRLLQCNTQHYRPSLAVIYATNCDDMAAHIDTALAERSSSWPPFDADVANLPDPSAGAAACRRLEQRLLSMGYDSEDWHSLVVGPEVEHIQAASGKRTLARTLLWRPNSSNPTDVLVAFAHPEVVNGLVDDALLEEPQAGFPLKVFCAGVLVVPDDGGAVSRGVTWIRPCDQLHDRALGRQVMADVAKIDVHDATTMVGTVMRADDTGANVSCMRYCAPSTDRWLGRRLRICITGHLEVVR